MIQDNTGALIIIDLSSIGLLLLMFPRMIKETHRVSLIFIRIVLQAHTYIPYNIYK